MKKFKKRPDTAVTAVRFDFEAGGFEYEKWGSLQTCKKGDWIVHSGNDTYTVDADTFAETYEETSPGRYIKTAPVWARVASADGSISTKEGETHYKAGDYIVCNSTDDSDCYAVSAESFAAMYEEAD